jgi:hypothetical protein
LRHGVVVVIPALGGGADTPNRRNRRAPSPSSLTETRSPWATTPAGGVTSNGCGRRSDRWAGGRGRRDLNRNALEPEGDAARALATHPDVVFLLEDLAGGDRGDRGTIRLLRKGWDRVSSAIGGDVVGDVPQDGDRSRTGWLVAMTTTPLVATGVVTPAPPRDRVPVQMPRKPPAFWLDLAFIVLASSSIGAQVSGSSGVDYLVIRPAVVFVLSVMLHLLVRVAVINLLLAG